MSSEFDADEIVEDVLAKLGKLDGDTDTLAALHEVIKKLESCRVGLKFGLEK